MSAECAGCKWLTPLGKCSERTMWRKKEKGGMEVIEVMVYGKQPKPTKCIGPTRCGKYDSVKDSDSKYGPLRLIK